MSPLKPHRAPAPESDPAEQDPAHSSKPGGKTKLKTLGERSGRLPESSAHLAPREMRGDIFEQNPLSQVSHQLDAAALALMDDSERVREAVRAVVERGGDIREVAREWKVAPSSITEWREKYYELLQQDSIATTGVPLFEPDAGRQDADLVRIPEAARLHFLENWQRLVEETTVSPQAFYQSPRQVFLENSWLTCWLYEDGELDKSILAGVGTVVVAVVVTASFLLARHRPVAMPAPPPAVVYEDTEIADRAVETAQAFFKAPDWRERLKFVRHPETVGPLMEEYYKTHPDTPIKDAKLMLGMNAKAVTSLSFEIPSQNRVHFLNVAKEKGDYLVDWETSSLFQEANLTSLRESKSTTPTRIAVTLSKDDTYYNYDFSDPARWVCFQLGYPGLPMRLYGYAPKDSQIAINLEAMLGILKKQAVVIEVRFPENAKSDNQVEIVKIIGEEWVSGT